MKKVLSAFVIMCVLAGSLAISVSADNIANGTKEDFEAYTEKDDVKTTRIYSTENDGESVYGTHFEFKQVDDAHKKSAVMKNVAGGAITFHPNKDNAADGVYHYSFELYPYTTDAKRILKIRESSNSKYFTALIFGKDGTIKCYEYADGLDSDASLASKQYNLGSYNAKSWYKIDLYLDTDANLYDVVVSSDGKEVGNKYNVALNDWGTGAKRFKIVQESTATTPYGDDLAAIDNVVFEAFTGKRPGADAAPSAESGKEDTKLNNAVVLKIGEATAIVNGNATKIDTSNDNIKAFTENDRTLVPVRFLAEAFGCKVSYADATQEVVIEGEKTVKMQINSNIMMVGDKQETIDQPAVLVDDARTFAPLRAVCELALGKTVLYKDGIIVVYDGSSSVNADDASFWADLEKAFK